jgi:GH25 family lysozyme M1 (1,4-beta-N-acetylmuramidase)
MKRILACLALVLTLVTDSSWAVSPVKIAQLGLGGRIAGIDISHWNHSGGAPIDFKKMYTSGVRFVMIKGGDAQTAADALALKYLLIDRKAAQQAHLYTGFYYYAYLPDSSDPTYIIKDARAQAQKVIWRIGQVGGYNSRDLPVALDLENNCQRVNFSGNCVKYMSRANVTLWAKTWLTSVAAKSHRKPLFYSYAHFLESAMVIDPVLRQFPLWMAHYSINPAISTVHPNAKSVGCFAHSWSNANCTAQWQFWQYSSCGIAGKYGVPGNRVDLNLFAGTSKQFLALTRGTWVPDPSDALPQDEPTTMQIVSQSSGTTSDPLVVTVDVLRPDQTPVVTGTVQFKSLDPSLPIGKQSAVRAATGRWTLSVTGLVAGNYLGVVAFTDPSGTHATSEVPVQFQVNPAPTPSPSPSPSSTISPTPSPSATSSPTKTKAPPVDSCAGQIRN